MGTLNPVRYQIKKHLMEAVDKYGCVRLREDIHCYSVPHTLIGKKLNIYLCIKINKITKKTQ